MEENKKHFSLFIKFGEEIHIKKLYEEGELYLNTIEYFTKKEGNKEIGDDWEDVRYNGQVKNFKLEDKDRTILTAPSANFQKHVPELGNLYCLWCLDDEYVLNHLNKNDNTLTFSTSEHKGFVNNGKLCYVVIKNLKEFIKRVENELNRMNLKFKMGPVTYFDEKTYSGPVNHFMKRKQYEKQQEFRILVHNTENAALIIHIGSILDIANYFDKEMEFKQTFEIKEER